MRVDGMDKEETKDRRPVAKSSGDFLVFDKEECRERERWLARQIERQQLPKLRELKWLFCKRPLTKRQQEVQGIRRILEAQEQGARRNLKSPTRNSERLEKERTRTRSKEE